MLSRLVLLSLRHRSLVIAIAVLIQGTLTALRTPLDVFPEFVQPRVTIQTEAPGLSAD